MIPARANPILIWPSFWRVWAKTETCCVSPVAERDSALYCFPFWTVIVLADVVSESELTTLSVIDSMTVPSPTTSPTKSANCALAPRCCNHSDVTCSRPFHPTFARQICRPHTALLPLYSSPWPIRPQTRSEKKTVKKDFFGLNHKFRIQYYILFLYMFLSDFLRFNRSNAS